MESRGYAIPGAKSRLATDESRRPTCPARLRLPVSESKRLGQVSLDMSRLVAKRLLMVHVISAGGFRPSWALVKVPASSFFPGLKLTHYSKSPLVALEEVMRRGRV